MPFWVYILRCADGSYYTGHTDNLDKRIAQHHAGEIKTCYTLKRRPLQLVFSQDFPTREEALAAERQIKGWGCKKKGAMMRGDCAEVSRLAKPKSVRPEPFGDAQDRLVEGREPPVHPSTVRQAHGSGRTDGEKSS
jgi:putative endonuclease